MSVTVIAIGSSIGLIHTLLMVAGIGAAATVASSVFSEATGSNGKNTEETNVLLLERLKSELSHREKELSADSSAAAQELLAHLRDFKSKLPSKIAENRDSAMTEYLTLIENLNEIKLDEKLCKERLSELRARIAKLQESSAHPYAERLQKLAQETEQLSRSKDTATERLFKMQGLLDSLAQMERFAAVAGDVNIEGLTEKRIRHEPNLNDKQARLELVVQEIRDFADRIARQDIHEGEKLLPIIDSLSTDTPFPERLEALKSRLRSEWGELRQKALLAEFFREKLNTLLPALKATPKGASLRQRAEVLMGGKYIDRPTFTLLYEDIAKFLWENREAVSDSLFAHRAGEILEEMGYELLTDEETAEQNLASGEVHYLDTPYDGYQVMMRVDSANGLTTRLVRTEKHNDRQKDIETGKKWCRDFDTFAAQMRESGTPIDVAVRREPEDTEILVMPQAKKRHSSKKRRAEKAENLRQLEN